MFSMFCKVLTKAVYTLNFLFTFKKLLTNVYTLYMFFHLSFLNTKVILNLPGAPK